MLSCIEESCHLGNVLSEVSMQKLFEHGHLDRGGELGKEITYVHSHEEVSSSGML